MPGSEGQMRLREYPCQISVSRYDAPQGRGVAQPAVFRDAMVAVTEVGKAASSQDPLRVIGDQVQLRNDLRVGFPQLQLVSLSTSTDAGNSD